MKGYKSKLDDFADQLEAWFGEDGKGMTLDAAVAELAKRGCKVSTGRLSKWWSDRQTKRSIKEQEDLVIAKLVEGASLNQRLDDQFKTMPAPTLITLVALLKNLTMQAAANASINPDLLKMVPLLIGPVIEVAKLEESRRSREFSEQKYRDQVAEKKASMQAQLDKAKAKGGITPETLARIEAELKLL